MTEGRKPKFFYGYVVVLAIFCILAVSSGVLYTFGVFLKPVITEFGWTRAMTSGAYSLFMVLHGVLYIVTGRLNDRFGPRLVVTAGGFFYGLGYLLMSQISAIWQLYLFYGVIAGIGMSGFYVPLVSTVSKWFIKRRGLITGIVLSGIGLGTIIMPPVANQLISTYGWRTSYIIVGIIALVLIISAAQFLRRSPDAVGQLPYGEGEVKQESLVLGARGFSLRKAIHTRQLWMLCAIFLGYGLFQQAIMVHIVIHAIGLGISAASAANILAVTGGASIAGRIVVGSAGDRIGNKSALIICFSLLSVVLFWLMRAQEVWMFYLFAAIFGFAYGGLITLQAPIIAELFGLSSHGIILGAVTFITTVGTAIGPLLAGGIFDITGSYNLAFLICAVVSIIALILTLFLRPTSNTDLRTSKK